MKRQYVAVLAGAGILFALALSDEGQRSETAKAAQSFASTPQLRSTARAFLQHEIILQGEHYGIAQLEYVLRYRDESAMKIVDGGAEDCAECLQRAAVVLGNPAEQTANRIAMGRALMQPASQAGTLLLVNAVLGAHFAGDAELKKGLIRALGEAQTPASAAALIDVIAKGALGMDFRQFPEDLQAAIRNAIRLNPFPLSTGQMLAAEYNYQASPEVARELEGLGQPVMLSILAKQSRDRGDESGAGRRVRQLAELQHPRALDGLMLLGVNGVLPPDEVNTMAYAWVAQSGGLFDLEHYAARLSDFDANAVQRSVSGFALAAAQDSASALYALRKASQFEADPMVRRNLESAISLVLDRPGQP